MNPKLWGYTVKKIMFVIAVMLASSSICHARTYAQVAIGGGYKLVILVANKTAFPWDGTFSLYQGNSNLWAGPWAVNGVSHTGDEDFAVSVNGYDTARLELTSNSGMQTGWLEYYGDGGSSSSEVAVSLFYQFYAGGKLTMTVGGGESEWGDTFYIPIERSASVNTGMAWAPSWSWDTAPFPIIFTLYRASESGGTVYGTKILDYSGQTAKFIDNDDLFPTLKLLENFRGFLKIESQEYIYLDVMRMDVTADGFLFTSTPPDPYTP
jgi:hypothetical protein